MNIQGDSNGGFQFQSQSEREVGDHFGGEDCGNSFSGHRGSSSLLHTQNGLVQCKASQSMEAHLHSNFEECDNGFSSSDQSSLGDDDHSMVEHREIG